MTRRMFRKQMLAMCLAAVSAGVTSSAPAQDYKRTNLFGNASTTVTPVRAGSAVSGPARTTVREVSIEDRQQQELNQLVAEAVKITSRRYLSADVHTPWQILHGILALRSEYQIKVDGQKSSALEWLANASSYQGHANGRVHSVRWAVSSVYNPVRVRGAPESVSCHRDNV